MGYVNKKRNIYLVKKEGPYWCSQPPQDEEYMALPVPSRVIYYTEYT